MRFVAQTLLEGVRLLGHDPHLEHLIVQTVRLALESTAIALLLGLPLACAIGLGRSRASGGAMVIANAGLGLPPVAVGVYLRLLVVSNADLQPPWGGSWWYSLNGMVLCQTIIALPIVVALAAVAVRDLPDGLLDQARAFGSSRLRLALFALREARLGVVTAVVIAIGSAIGEVGAISLVIATFGPEQTLATQVLADHEYNDGLPYEVEHVLVLLAMMALLGLVLALARRSGWRARRRDARARSAAVTQASATVAEAVI